MPLLSLLVCAWVMGIVLTDAHASSIAWGICMVLAGFGWQRHRPALIHCAIALAAGCLRVVVEEWHPPPTPTVPAWYCVDALQSTWQEQRITAFNQHHAGIQLTLPVTQSLVVGDCMYVTGSVRPITSSHQAYLAQLQRRHITHHIDQPHISVVQGDTSWRHAIEWWRIASTRKLQYWIREPTATIMAGMLLGVNGDVSPSVSTAFKLSGTTHMLVISGWNISIVAWLCVTLTQRFAHYRVTRSVVIIGFIAVYVCIAGASAAVVRAGIMGGVAVIGKALNRPRHALNLIAIATLCMSVYDVSVLWDLGFQLSTLATIGLISFGNRVEAVISRSPLAHPSLAWMRESLTATVAAHITTWPIMLFRLGTPSPWSVLANIIVAPIVPLAMAVGCITLVVIWLAPPLMGVMHWLVYPPFLWIITGSMVMATLPAPAKLLFTVDWGELCGHGLWVTYLCYTMRHDICATLGSDESGIVS